MKLVIALSSAILFVSIFFTHPAQAVSLKRGPLAAPQRRTRTARRKPKTTVAARTSSLIKTLPSGLSYIVTHSGEGRQPLAGERVIVNYTGLLGNGVKFDSSLDRGQPFSFELGKGRVIKGWDEGISKLHVGDQATLIIPPLMAYGEKGIGPIPPNSTLIFIVELMGIEETPKTP
jgi:peptidylprolyl isomerase